MPALKNAKHERFAQMVAFGTAKNKAFERVGYAPNDQNASRLTRSDAVARRIRELQDAAHSTLVTDKAYVMASLREVADRCMARQAVLVKGRLVAFRFDSIGANKALELLGKEIGMFVERVEQDTSLRVISAQPVSEEDWEARYARSLEGASTPLIEGNGHGADSVEARPDQGSWPDGDRARGGQDEAEAQAFEEEGEAGLEGDDDEAA